MMVDRVHKQKTGKLNHVSFDKIVKLPCRNNGYPIKGPNMASGEVNSLLKNYKITRAI